MDSDRPTNFVVRLALCHAERVVVRRLRLRFRAGRPAGAVLDTLLRRVMAERRRNGSVRVGRAPDELAAASSTSPTTARLTRTS